MRRLLNIFRISCVTAYKEVSAYRLGFFITIVAAPIAFFAYALIWKAVYQNQTAVGGLSYHDMLFYYAGINLVWTLVYDWDADELEENVRTGLLSVYFLRPMSYRFYRLGYKAGVRSFACLMEFVPMYLVYLLVFRLWLVPPQPLLTIVSVMLSFVMAQLVNFTIGISSFWLTRTGGLRHAARLITSILAGAVIPLTFFPQVVQRILFFLPFQFVHYVPLRTLLGSYELAGITMTVGQIVWVQAGAVLIMSLFVEALWRIAVRRFTGVGI